MTIDTEPSGNPRWMLWTGRGIATLVVVALGLDAGIKLVPLQPVIDTSALLGWQTDTATLRGLGILLLACVLLYALPSTALLGTILLTAYLGGAVATHARIESPLFTHTLFGVYLGVFVWAGLWFREPTLRAMLPVRRHT